MCGVEIVKNKETKEKFGREHQFTKRVNDLVNEAGLLTRVWDTIHFAPPFVITTDDGTLPCRTGQPVICNRTERAAPAPLQDISLRASAAWQRPGNPSLIWIKQ